MVQRGAPEKPYPRFIPPMECLATEKLPEGDQWTYEAKWDGYRTLAVKSGKTVGLYSDQGNSHSEKFPGVVFALRENPVDKVVLDGEVVALKENGVPDFQQLQNWRTTKYPIIYYVFDVLHHNSKDVLGLSLTERREILAELSQRFRDPIRISQEFDTNLDDFVAGIKTAGLEGVIAKNRHSRYESGKRSGAWLKKRFGQVGTFVIGAFTPGANGVDSILIGEWRGDKLYFLDKVRAGLISHTRRTLYEALAPLVTKTCPFVNLPEPRNRAHAVTEEEMRKCVWVKPERLVEIEFVSRTKEKRLRHAKFRRLL
ncbi:MAG: dependent ligase [Candidatus Sulfotelmatobacter sp.]|nr:dependent ligase [Candidatus Sulfotelmatobacter sp.]